MIAATRVTKIESVQSTIQCAAKIGRCLRKETDHVKACLHFHLRRAPGAGRNGSDGADRDSGPAGYLEGRKRVDRAQRRQSTSPSGFVERAGAAKRGIYAPGRQTGGS